MGIETSLPQEQGGPQETLMHFLTRASILRCVQSDPKPPHPCRDSGPWSPPAFCIRAYSGGTCPESSRWHCRMLRAAQAEGPAAGPSQSPVSGGCWATTSSPGTDGSSPVHVAGVAREAGGAAVGQQGVFLQPRLPSSSATTGPFHSGTCGPTPSAYPHGVPSARPRSMHLPGGLFLLLSGGGPLWPLMLTSPCVLCSWSQTGGAEMPWRATSHTAWSEAANPHSPLPRHPCPTWAPSRCAMHPPALTCCRCVHLCLSSQGKQKPWDPEDHCPDLRRATPGAWSPGEKKEWGEAFGQACGPPCPKQVGQLICAWLA
ncbi:PREDICTED: uncharacterized protein LOC108534084 [Rhinopithecus bieti]|uniref:uncharacterized protein LOC108534084 n=1 Tax=Rhinopithecus bieti TaxID=61621 RepID=UPI00083BD832|nr:PREDICTED: uncharacterized protein LOC108534084 [Rhinopithecus bieti]